MAMASNHKYADEVFNFLSDEEAKQEAVCHFLWNDVAVLDVFSKRKQVCVEAICGFSVMHKLQQKTTEASFVYLDRFLTHHLAISILNSDSGLKNAKGK